MPSFKQKIVNDPVHGFITIPNALAFELIEHRWLQRLRNIKQLGLSYLVYPGAVHNRFQHTLGAMHLMTQAIQVLKEKGIEITSEEEEGAIAAILLHDLGHGPYSHALEHSFSKRTSHELLSMAFMNQLNRELGGRLDMAIAIFSNQYSKKFLHQLVSSQLDVDRLDYLRRDSFFSGVAEGTIGLERIIKMLYVTSDELVVEAKGIYSIEKFLIARRMMYWQVYLHKTVVGAEQMLIAILRRARELVEQGIPIAASPRLHFFLSGRTELEPIESWLDMFASLDDSDIALAIKDWMNHPDTALADMCCRLNNRRLLHVELSGTPFSHERVALVKEVCRNRMNLSDFHTGYLCFAGEVTNSFYNPKQETIKILFKNNRLEDIYTASEMLNHSALGNTVKKYFFCYPKEIVGWI